jgi:hypothetical protein
MTKEIVLVFEDPQKIKSKLDQEQIQVNVEKPSVDFDITQIVKVVADTVITNEDGTLNLSVKENNVNINTNIVQRYADNYSFPNRGKENVLYVDTKNHKIYYWINGRYQVLSEYEEPNIISGGDANGR